MKTKQNKTKNLNSENKSNNTSLFRNINHKYKARKQTKKLSKVEHKS